MKVPPRFELGSLDSKSRVLTITPWDLAWKHRLSLLNFRWQFKVSLNGPISLLVAGGKKYPRIGLLLNLNQKSYSVLHLSRLDILQNISSNYFIFMSLSSQLERPNYLHVIFTQYLIIFTLQVLREDIKEDTYDRPACMGSNLPASQRGLLS